MILKIKYKDSWIYYDSVDKFIINCDSQYEYFLEDNKYDNAEDNKCIIRASNGDAISVDAMYINIDKRDAQNDEKNNFKAQGDCTLLEIIRYTNNDTSYFSRLIAINDKAYLLNNKGKTIERI